MLHIKHFRLIAAVLALLCCSCSPSFAQLDGKKNTVKINLTNPLIFGSKAFIVGYERVVSQHQTFSIGIGRMSLPAFRKGAGSDSISLQNNTNEKGFNISADYRFYLSKENKYEAPRGVYIGPYYSYNHFSRSNKWLMNTSSFEGEVNTNTALTINTIGAELGYQFVLWKKLAVDMILAGPGVGFYQVKAGINTSLDQGDKELFYQHLNDFLNDKIPGYNKVISEGEFIKNGSAKNTALGFRYMINLGFRF